MRKNYVYNRPFLDGPTLFKIYILDTYLSATLFSLRIADDFNLVGRGNERQETEIEINNELKKMSHDTLSNPMGAGRGIERWVPLALR